MSVLIKDIEKPKSCYAVIDGESEYCPFVNTDDDCILLLKKGTCEGTWADQYSKCPLIEAPEPCEDAVSRNAIIQKLNTMDRYVSEELILCDTDKKYPKNEVFIVDDVYEEIVENLPSAQPEQRWISVSERLPDIKEHHCSEPCIVYCENGAYGFAELEENIFGQVGWNCERDDEYHEPLGKVLAWMSLPEPYKAESE